MIRANHIYNNSVNNIFDDIVFINYCYSEKKLDVEFNKNTEYINIRKYPDTVHKNRFIQAKYIDYNNNVVSEYFDFVKRTYYNYSISGILCLSLDIESIYNIYKSDKFTELTKFKPVDTLSNSDEFVNIFNKEVVFKDNFWKSYSISEKSLQEIFANTIAKGLVDMVLS